MTEQAGVSRHADNPLASRRLAQPNARFAGDQGDADVQARAALAQAAAAGTQQAYLDAVVALGEARLLLPVMAAGDDGHTGPNPERRAEFSAVLVENAAGAKALLAFTGLDSLHAWNRTARPVPCTLDELAATVHEAGAEALLVDGAGPEPFVLAEDVLDALSQGRRLVRLGDGGYGWLMPAREGDEISPGQTPPVS